MQLKNLTRSLRRLLRGLLRIVTLFSRELIGLQVGFSYLLLSNLQHNLLQSGRAL